VIGRVVAFCARRPGLIIAIGLLAALAGEAGRRSCARDALPDLADPRVAVVADWMGHAAAEVADRVTRPLTVALDGVPGAVAIRGSSMSGMAYVEVVFDAASRVAPGRAEISRRLAAIDFPNGLRVQVGPEASGAGWVLQYVLALPGVRDMHHFEGDRISPQSPTGMRRHQDEVIRPALAAIPGVAEVASVGGEGEQLVVEARPADLRRKGVAFSDVVASVRAALATSRTKDRTMDRVGAALDPAVAQARLAGEMASGFADLDGFIPAVGGIVIARPDADVVRLIDLVKAVLERERARLPRGVELVVVYDRSELARGIERTELRALAEEVGVVAFVLLLFLLHGRSALLPMATLPLVVLLAFGAMWLLGVRVTVMSLSGIGIALGMAVDAEVVALEACHRRLERDGSGAAGRRAHILAAGGAFAPAIITSLVIAALSFLPVLAFTGETGRLLRPLALSKTLVFAAAALVAVTVAPALRDRVLAAGRIIPELANPLTRRLVAVYRPFVRFALERPGLTIATAGLAIASSVLLAPRLGAEFLPRLDEGDLLYMPTTAAGVKPDAAADQVGRQDLALRGVSEVRSVFGKVGRADTATDPAPYTMAETTVRLQPRENWPRSVGSAELIQRLDQVVRRPGWNGTWTGPVRARIDMMSTGVRTPVGLRIVAADPARLAALSDAARAAVERVPGTASAVSDSLGEEVRIGFVPDPDAIARHHVDPALARATADLILSGGQVGEIDREGRRLRVRVLPEPLTGVFQNVRPDADRLRDATVRAGAEAGAAPVPLALLGRVALRTEPALVRVEHGQLCTYVHIAPAEATDLGDYVARARRAVASAIPELRPDERLEWVGQYELWQAGWRRLLVITPIVLLAALLLLVLQFRSLTEALIVITSVPFAMVGSLWTLYVLGYKTSAPVWVGLLSVIGLAVQMGVVMVVYIDDAFHRRLREGRMETRADIVDAHAEGTVLRLRPKLMTLITMAAALAPLLWADGPGAEIMKRVAAPMLGGLITSGFLTLEVLPVLYTIWRHRQLLAAQRTGRPLAEIVGHRPPWAR